MRCAIVHYHELALKGRNRPYFQNRLVRHLRALLKPFGIRQIDALPGRVRVMLPEEVPWDGIKDALARVFGVTHFSLARSIPLSADGNLDAMKAAIGEAVTGRSFGTFRVSTKRADKRYPLTSIEIDRAIGAHICALTGKRVSLGAPDLTVEIEVLTRDAYVSLEREEGPGGLPTGVSGKVACLLSGGIDSPVAAYRMMKRGCRAVFVHFHGRPYVTRASEEKVRELVALLTRYQLYSRLYLVAFGDIQRQIVLGAPAPFRIVLYRRLMLRIAEEVARRERCWALVTGDSLGQVASQTPENLTVVQEAAQLPVLRPLIGMDKLEITREAERIGTFETSIEPDQDCCRLFVPAHPVIRSDAEHVRRIERGFDLGALVKEGLERMEMVEAQFPARVRTAL
jgi:thiamine biosynthesis protein ThiI